MMANELTITKNQSLLPSEHEFSQLITIAKHAAASALYRAHGGFENVFLIIAAAREIGIPPMMALNGGFHNIKGKVEISARTLNALIRKHGHSITIVQCDGRGCVLEGKRADNGDVCRCSFSLEDARIAGLVGDNWKKYAQDMMWARAISRLGRRLFPDVIGTCYVEGEVSGEMPQADVVEIETPQHEEISQEDILKVLDPAGKNDPNLIMEYVVKYCEHHSKSQWEMVEDYREEGKFERDFYRWLKKNSRAA